MQNDPNPKFFFPPIFKHLWFQLIMTTLIIIIIFSIIILVLPASSINIADQHLGTTIAVKKLDLKKGGYLSIHTANRYNKPLNRIIAITEYLPAGVYSDFSIDFINDPQTDANESRPKPGDLLFAMIYEDSDNDFRPSTADAVMKDWTRKQIIKSFKIK